MGPPGTEAVLNPHLPTDTSALSQAPPINKKPAAGCPGRVSFRCDSDQLPDSVFSPAFFQPAMPLE
jgi:hypothetical protein